jgi:hypothetical protein
MGSIGSLFGQNSNNVPVNTFQMPGMTDTANQASSGTTAMGQTLDQLLAQYMPQMNTQLGANTAGGQAGSNMATSTIPGATAIGQGSMQGAQQLQGGANSIMNTAFDPQSALYNQLFQQNQDMANVQNTMSGVGTTPYGAGVADQSGQNFNINWQNQQLGRQATGLQGAEAAYGAAQPLGNAGQAGLVQSAMLPYATQSAAAGANTQALQGGIGATTTASQPTIQDLLSYLGVGNQTNQIYNQGQIGGTNATTAQQQAGWGQLGNLADLGFSLGSTPISSMAPAGSAFGGIAGMFG